MAFTSLPLSSTAVKTSNFACCLHIVILLDDINTRTHTQNKAVISLKVYLNV